MAEGSIPVDLFNPGQVFACIGFLEAADLLLGHAEAVFDSMDGDSRFLLRADTSTQPFVAVLRFLADAEVRALAPSRSGQSTEEWKVPTDVLAVDDPFPFPDPPSPATLPAVLQPSADKGDTTRRLVIDHWGEDSRTGLDPVKFWGGAGGYPGAALLRDALDLVREHCVDAFADPFALSYEQSSSFRFDWRRDYIPIDAGFSLNIHGGKIATVGFPLVEVLAAVGLTHTRPRKVSKLEYTYAVLGRSGQGTNISLFTPSILRAALGNAALPFPRRTFRMYLGWPAKEGQARAITAVTEESAQ